MNYDFLKRALNIVKSSLNSLQLAIYFLLSKHSMFPWFSPIINIGIFNPRLNIAYTLNMLTVPEDVIREIETEVIGYEKYQLSL